MFRAKVGVGAFGGRCGGAGGWRSLWGEFGVDFEGFGVLRHYRASRLQGPLNPQALNPKP